MEHCLKEKDIRDFARNAGMHGIGWYRASGFKQYLETVRESRNKKGHPFPLRIRIRTRKTKRITCRE